jgi:hypothetical protein
MDGAVMDTREDLIDAAVWQAAKELCSPPGSNYSARRLLGFWSEVLTTNCGLPGQGIMIEAAVGQRFKRLCERLPA